MNRVKEASQYVLFAVVACAMLIATILPAIASAAQITTKSMSLENPRVGVEDVTYKLSFTAIGAADELSVEFCDSAFGNCIAPGGMSAVGASTATSGFTISGTPTANEVVFSSTIAAGTVTVDIDGIDNPSDEGTIYARIATSITNDPVDSGVIAISIVPTIQVSGIVEEYLDFCVSAAAIATEGSCVNSDDPIALSLGDDGVLGFDSIETAKLYAQLSTNARNGARVYLKSYANDCGGLYIGTSTVENCFIKPAVGADANMTDNPSVDPDQAAFGVMVAPGALGSGAALAAIAPYTGTDYNMDFATGNGSGVTSAFGDQFMQTTNTASNRTAEITFGATINNQTPAGSYTTILSLIAAGVF